MYMHTVDWQRADFCFFVKTRKAFWVKLGEQLTLPVCEGGGYCVDERTEQNSVITGRALQPSKY